MNDTLFIRKLRIETIIGVHEWERSVRQTLVLDLELACDIGPAASTDQLALALDYYTVSERLLRLGEESDFLLVERFAQTAAQMLMQEFDIPWLRMHVAKPGAVAEADEVGITIERGRRN